jgi:hypothetical protein
MKVGIDVEARYSPIVAWYVLSNVSYIWDQYTGVVYEAKEGRGRTKRVIKLVLPTLCSPRKTSLNFFIGLVADEKSVGVAGV